MEEYMDSGIKISNDMILKTFFRMFLGLLATAIIAFFTYSTGIFLTIPYGVVAIIEIAVVIIFSLCFKKLPPLAVTILYFLYAVINGVTMGCIFAVYSMSTIGIAFLAAAGLFGGCAAYGHFTKKDMSKFGPILTIALIIALVVSVINLILGNSMIDIILDWIVLIIFAVLTMVDMQKIKYMSNMVDCDEEKIYVYCAMELYLDFINMFIRLLSIFGRRRD